MIILVIKRGDIIVVNDYASMIGVFLDFHLR